jgi:Putative zinc-finger
MSGECTGAGAGAGAAALVEKLFDGEASAEEQREAETHLETCASCRSHLEFLRSMSERVRAHPLPDPPEAYWEHLPRKILSRIEREPASVVRRFLSRMFAPGGLRRLAPSLALMSSFVLVLVVGLRFLRESPGGAGREARSESPAAASPLREAAPATESRGVRESGDAKRPAEDGSEPVSRALPPAASAAAAPPMSRDENLDVELQKSETARHEENAVADAARRSTPQAGAPAALEGPERASASARATSEPAPAGISRPSEARERAPISQPAAASDELVRSLDAVARASADADADCTTFRDTLARLDAAPGASPSVIDVRKTDVRYQLARCSLGRFRREGGEALRKAALADGDDFLAHETKGPRAEEIRTALDGIRPRENED